MADRSKVGLSTIRKFETEVTSPHTSTLTLLRHTFEAASVEFTDDNGIGVKLKG